MFFLFQKKKIVLDCFTHSEIILQTAPITEAIRYIPDWWKKLPKSYYADTFFPKTTMKGCFGMIDYYTNSVALPLWSDLVINVSADRGYQWQFSDKLSDAAVHDKNQHTDFLNDHGHLKLITPWCLKTKEDIKWVWSQPTYSFNSDIAAIKILPAVVNFKYQNGANINLMLPLEQPKRYFLEQGQVLAHLTPLSENRIEIVRHLIDKKEYEKIIDLHTSITFTNKYKNIIKQKQKFSDCSYYKDK